MHNWTEQDWTEVIAKGESEVLEFKKNTGMLKEAIQTLCGMANRHGGTVLFGVTDKGEAVGQNISDDTLRAISQGIQLNTEPRLYPSIERITILDRTCIAVTIEESPIKPHFAYGRPWIRVGSTTQQMGRDEYEIQLLQRNNGYAFDHLALPGATMDDINTEDMLAMLERANSIRNLNVNLLSDKEELLAKLGLLTEKQELTKAAVLLFGKDPQRFFMGYYETRCGSFTDDEGYQSNTGDQMFRGNLFNQFQAIYDYISQRLNLRTHKTATGTEAHPEMPFLMVREAIVNMLVHRDYRNGIVNGVEIRPSFIAISNPGHLFSPAITLQTLEAAHPSKPGNKRIAQTFFLSGLFEQWGSGTTTMIRLAEQAGLPRPEFRFEGGVFSIKLFRK